MSRARDVSLVRALQPLGVRAAVCADRRAAGLAQSPVLLDAGGMDCRVHGQRAQRRHGVQPSRGRAIRRAQPAHRDARAAARRHEPYRGRAVCRRVVDRLRVRGLATQHAVPRAGAGGAGHRVLVLAGQARHHLHPTLPRPGTGRRTGRRLDCRRRPRRHRAVAAGPRDRIVGGRIRHSVCLSGCGVRSRSRPAIDPGQIRRRAPPSACHV